MDLSAILPRLEGATNRVVELLRTVKRPDTPAIGEWSAAEVAAHLSHVYAGDARALREEPMGIEGNPLTGGARTVSEMNAALLQADPERDLGRLAARISASSTALVDAARAAGEAEAHSWLGGIKLPASAIVCHLLSEALLHGMDIARAEGQPWEISRTDALLVLERFLFPLLTAIPRAPASAGASGRRGGSFEIRLRGGGRHTIALRGDGLTLTEDGNRVHDCHISADPVAFLLVGWRRVPRLRAIVTGGVIAWGRRPWLMRRFARAFRLP